MWLLDVKSRKLVLFLDDRQVVGKYAILSHTWDEDEVTFADIHKPDALLMKGYKKIEYTCRQAEKDGLAYAWVDTCCINKDSSAELSESINSMFRWYQNSAVCYVYVVDVSLLEPLQRYPPSISTKFSSPFLADLFRHCRWVTRGWTLQEMLAPESLAVFDCDWHLVGTLRKRDPDARIAEVLSTLTGVDLQLLKGEALLDEYPIAERISWASGRATTRVEDTAYSLLGLLRVSMPLLYGEGTKAFLRLQEEVLRSTTDRSVLLWGPHTLEQTHMLFAPDISCFKGGHYDWRRVRSVADSDNILTNRGLRTTLSCMQLPSSDHVMASPCDLDPALLDPRTVIMLQRVSPLEGQNAAGRFRIPVFEVIRTIEPRTRRQDLTWTGQSWAQQELVLLREAQDFIYHLDIDHGLEAAPVDVRTIRPSPTQMRCQRPIKAIRVNGLKTNSRHEFELGPRSAVKNESTDWVKDEFSVAGQKQEVVRGALWTRQHRHLSTACPLPPGHSILRIWYSELNLSTQAIYEQSLPTPICLERLLIMAMDLMDHGVWEPGLVRDRLIWRIERIRRETVLNRDRAHYEGYERLWRRMSKRP